MLLQYYRRLLGYLMCERFVEVVELFARLHREGDELNYFVFTAILNACVQELGCIVFIFKLGQNKTFFCLCFEGCLLGIFLGEDLVSFPQSSS